MRLWCACPAIPSRLSHGLRCLPSQDDVFQLRLPDVGTPTFLGVRSDATGAIPSWHLDMAVLIIQRGDTTQTVWFVGQRWLSPEAGLEVGSNPAATAWQSQAGDRVQEESRTQGELASSRRGGGYSTALINVPFHCRSNCRPRFRTLRGSCWNTKSLCTRQICVARAQRPRCQLTSMGKPATAAPGCWKGLAHLSEEV